MMKWKCATMKYVSCQCTSSELVATATPDMPPNTNRNTNENTYSIGVDTVMRPPHIVPIHANTLIAEKIATNIDSAPNRPTSNVDMPATNMWWPHVRKPTSAMPAVATTMPVDDAGGVLLIGGTTSLTTPLAGQIMMETAGGEE